MIAARAIAVLGALAACLVLAGCVLGAQEALFDDSRSQLILGETVGKFTLFHRNLDAWELAEDPLVSMNPEGRHYLLPDPDHPDDHAVALTVHFVALDADHWLMQMSFSDPATLIDAYYAVATWDENELLIAPIDCVDLRDRPGIAQLVDFSDDDCVLKSAASGKSADFPTVLWQDLSPPTARLVRQR